MGAEYPYPPRMMTKQRAAHYCDLSVPEFEREVAGGKLPLPIALGNREHWSRVALDEHLARLAGEAEADDWRKRSKLYGNAA